MSPGGACIEICSSVNDDSNPTGDECCPCCGVKASKCDCFDQGLAAIEASHLGIVIIHGIVPCAVAANRERPVAANAGSQQGPRWQARISSNIDHAGSIFCPRLALIQSGGITKDQRHRDLIAEPRRIGGGDAEFINGGCAICSRTGVDVRIIGHALSNAECMAVGIKMKPIGERITIYLPRGIGQPVGSIGVGEGGDGMTPRHRFVGEYVYSIRGYGGFVDIGDGEPHLMVGGHPLNVSGRHRERHCWHCLMIKAACLIGDGPARGINHKAGSGGRGIKAVGDAACIIRVSRCHRDQRYRPSRSVTSHVFGNAVLCWGVTVEDRGFTDIGDSHRHHMSVGQAAAIGGRHREQVLRYCLKIKAAALIGDGPAIGLNRKAIGKRRIIKAVGDAVPTIGVGGCHCHNVYRPGHVFRNAPRSRSISGNGRVVIHPHQRDGEDIGAGRAVRIRCHAKQRQNSRLARTKRIDGRAISRHHMTAVKRIEYKRGP